MASARDVALYFLQLDNTQRLFNKDRVLTENGRTFYEGNARLNKYLHLAQNIYYAKTSSLLFSEPLYAYDNGGIVKDIQENYPLLLSQRNTGTPQLTEEQKLFLNKLYRLLADASVIRLIELSHEDPAWQSKHMFYYAKDQMMDTLGSLEDYKERYEDVLELLERMPS